MSRLPDGARYEALADLSQGVAHDFYHVLGIIKNMTKMALRDLPLEATQNTRVQEDFGYILDAVEHGESLARSLMAFSQTAVTYPTIFSLNETIEELRPLIESFDTVKTKFDLDPDLWKIKADRGQITQVLMNLAINARDAMQESGGQITICTRNSLTRYNDDLCEGGKFRVYLSVEDAGCGVPPEIRDRIFEPFFTTKRGNGSTEIVGSGMGLAAVYGIVQRAGGKVDVTSTEGVGSKFGVELPAGVQRSAAR